MRGEGEGEGESDGSDDLKKNKPNQQKTKKRLYDQAAMESTEQEGASAGVGSLDGHSGGGGGGGGGKKKHTSHGSGSNAVALHSSQLKPVAAEAEAGARHAVTVTKPQGYMTINRKSQSPRQQGAGVGVGEVGPTEEGSVDSFGEMTSSKQQQSSSSSSSSIVGNPTPTPSSPRAPQLSKEAMTRSHALQQGAEQRAIKEAEALQEVLLAMPLPKLHAGMTEEERHKAVVLKGKLQNTYDPKSGFFSGGTDAQKEFVRSSAAETYAIRRAEKARER